MSKLGTASAIAGSWPGVRPSDESGTEAGSFWPLLQAVSVRSAVADAGSAGSVRGQAEGILDRFAQRSTTQTTPGEQWNITKLFGSAATAKAMLAKYNGAGVHVGVYDDGIDKSASALMTHYDATREVVINNRKADPGILSGNGQGIHGTATNGIIGADPTKTGGQVTGIAYGASLTDVNIFSGLAASNSVEAIRQMAKFDVTSNSWGWSVKWADLGYRPYIDDFAYAAANGRGTLGTVIVKAAGNDWWTDHRDAATQEFNVDRHVVTVGAIDSNDTVAWYSQRGASLLTSAPSNGADLGITTTDRPGSAGYASGDITTTFGGTSAAAPEVAAVVADMLGANNRLGARDVQVILALASHDNETSGFTTAATGNMAYGWTVNHAGAAFNGGGYHFSNDEGFGELNAHDAIREAAAWSYMNPIAQTSQNEVHLAATAGGAIVPATASGASLAFTITKAETVENADLTLDIATANLNNLQVVLTSPSGTRSIILDVSQTLRGESTNDATGGTTLTLGSHAFLGEAAQGTWKAQVIDKVAGDAVRIKSATLDLYGSAPSQSHQFHYTDEAIKMDAFDPGRITLHDPSGVGSWIDTAMMTGIEVIDLHAGRTSTENGKAFLTIGTDTTINKLILGDGNCTVTCNDNGDTVVSGNGTAQVLGGKGNDIFVAGSGSQIVTGGGGSDTFVFNHAGFGSTLITDFSQGADHLDLRGLGTDLNHIRIADNGVAITISNIDTAGDTIQLANTHHQHLNASDFLFA